MAENDFWELIAVMGGEADDDALERLGDALAKRGRKDAIAFQERLTVTLHDLDREVLADQPVRFDDEPEDSGIIPMSVDTFLYLRAGLISRGRAVVEAVLADPTELSRGVWPECEGLLDVAENVVGDDIETKVSYETGENRTHWTRRPEPVREPWDEGPRIVVVECRDLGEPIEGEFLQPDGSFAPDVMYPPPSFLDFEVVSDLAVTFTRIVTTNGGLPAGFAADRIQVRVDFGAEWSTVPELLGRVRDNVMMLDDDTMFLVRVAANAADIKALEADGRRRALESLIAPAVLAALPNHHAALPALEAMTGDPRVQG